MSSDPDASMTGTASLPKINKSHELARSTIRAPTYAYAHLELFNAEFVKREDLDAIQVKSYCTAALTQFLGTFGMAISMDILKVEGQRCWLRLPRDDLGAFAAAIMAWQGTTQDGVHSTFRILGCSDWLGALVGQEDEERLWTS